MIPFQLPLPARQGRLERAWQSVRILGRRYIGLIRAVAFTASYAIWVMAFKLLTLTFVTYFLTSSAASGRPPRFDEISESFGSAELTLMGLCALLFVVLLRALNPVTSTTTAEIFTPERLEKRFLPGFLHGSLLASGVILAFLLGGAYRYLGFFIQFDEAPLALGGVLLRILSLGALAYFEEFVFRHKILKHIRAHTPPSFWGDLGAAGLIALIYCGIKTLQFDLGLMHLGTLFLLSLALSLRSLSDSDFARGAGFWAALLIVFQPLLSLPVLGNDFSGVLLVKYQPALQQAAADAGGPDATLRFLTGGVGGPFSGLAFQIVLLLDVVRSALRYKKTLSTPSAQRIK